jgi:hypothetical protein
VVELNSRRLLHHLALTSSLNDHRLCLLPWFIPVQAEASGRFCCYEDLLVEVNCAIRLPWVLRL